jgi:NADH-quinone oxidoreductase subunit N
VKAGDLLTISPLIALTLAPVVVMLAAAFRRSHALALALTLAGLAATFGLLFVSASRAQRAVTPLVSMDAYTLFFIGLLTAATAVVAILSWGYLKRLPLHPEEYYVLLLTATLGGAALVASTHFASFFLGLEILSVSLYALIVYPVHRAEAVEAAVKYLVLAGATSAFLIFGMALVYAESGTMSAVGVAKLLAGLGSESVIITVGVVMILVGVGFKLAVVPFHMWTPDVYEGAPAPVTAYVATVSKGAVFALLLRYMLPVSSDTSSTLFLALAAVAIASMLAGNLLALRQDNVKRILAYSSIAHLGYLLVAFLAAGERAGVAASFYLVAYFATTLVAFGVVTVLSTGERDAGLMLDYRGLGARRPWLAAIFTVALLSLAGMPLTMGFIGKFLIVTAGSGAALWALVIVLVVSSTIGLYYYTRLIVEMYVRRPEELHPAASRPGAGAAAAQATAWSAAAFGALAALTVVLVVFGVYPSPLIRLVEHAVSVLPWP